MKRFCKAFVVSGINTLGAVLGLNVTEHNGVSTKQRHKQHTVTGINIMVIPHRATLYLAIHFIEV
jgi:hypothetical protein